MIDDRVAVSLGPEVLVGIGEIDFLIEFFERLDGSFAVLVTDVEIFGFDGVIFF